MRTSIMIPTSLMKMLLPLACKWAEEQESIVLRDGEALTPAQILDARQIGIQAPERVRLKRVEEIFLPTNPMLRSAAERTGLISPSTIGLTLRYGILVRADHWGERRLLIHELTHTAQYERLGGFHEFLSTYLEECLTVGYPNGALEQEAKAMEQRVQ